MVRSRIFEEDSLSSYRSKIYLPAIYLPFVFLLKKFLFSWSPVHPWTPGGVFTAWLHSTPVRQRHSICVLLPLSSRGYPKSVTHLSAPSCLSLRFHSSVQINYLPISLTICVSPLCYTYMIAMLTVVIKITTPNQKKLGQYGKRK